MTEHEGARDYDRDSTALVDVEKLRPADYDGSCLRPLGLCELGGSCDACWYSPEHPRFKNPQSD